MASIRGFAGRLAAACAAATVASGADEAPRGPAAPPKAPRFEVTDRAWPAAPGEASVCLWRDDKLAAVTLTIDDNWAPDHEWWIEQARAYRLRLTWFVIAGRIGPNGGLWGTWEQFARLQKEGHDVQSHTVTHFHDEALDTAAEYAQSAEIIRTNLPGSRPLALAYPGGKNSHRNDRDVAAKTYLAARGTTGQINPAAQVDYLRTGSLGGGLAHADGAAPWADARNLLARSARYPQHWRGWYCVHYHGAKPDAREAMVADFAWLREREADLWVGLFREVAQYGQERDTARLSAAPGADGALAFDLADAMDDALFDVPLTVKVRLPDGWTGAEARQGAAAVAVRVVEREGARYALVEAVPDRGRVVVARAGPPEPGN